MSNFKILETLINCPSPSGYEFVAQETISGLVKDPDEYYTDGIGNRAWSKGTGETMIVLSAHIDTLGLMVTHLTESGSAKVIPLGGVDKKTLPGSVFRVYPPASDLSLTTSVIPPFKYGIIGKKPIHVESPSERETVSKISDLSLDIIGGDKPKIGSVAVPDINPIMSGSEIFGPGLDDKAGIFVALSVFNDFDPSSNPDVKLVFASLTQEEEGLRGASVFAHNLADADYYLDIDVTFDTSEGQGIDKGEYGDISLGKGPVIFHGPGNHPGLVKLLLESASGKDYQETACHPEWTNSGVIQRVSENGKVGHLGIPLRNMHIPVEVVNKFDLLGAIEVIKNLIKNLS